jgi:hypothetical protein
MDNNFFSRRNFLVNVIATFFGLVSSSNKLLGNEVNEYKGGNKQSTEKDCMSPIAYGRSFSVGLWEYNEVRFWIESRVKIIDYKNDKIVNYFQAASCKSENTFADKNLFRKDNYDFLPVFGPEYGIIFRRHASYTTNYREVKPASEMWGGQKYYIFESENFKKLNSFNEIVEATHQPKPLVGQTEIWNDELNLRAIIEYPIKTININKNLAKYQVDTGPILFPELIKQYNRTIDSLNLAYIAFNQSSFADFVIEVPTPVESVDRNHNINQKVYHYSKLVSKQSINRLYVIE